MVPDGGQSFDCPSVRCRGLPAANYSNNTRAHIQMVSYLKTTVRAKFPKKLNPDWNVNFLISLEPYSRFHGLESPKWHKENAVDVLGTHHKQGAKVSVPISYVELPGDWYRRTGPSFAERSNRTAFFTTNCRGSHSVSRSHALNRMSNVMALDWFMSGPSTLNPKPQTGCPTLWRSIGLVFGGSASSQTPPRLRWARGGRSA